MITTVITIHIITAVCFMIAVLSQDKGTGMGTAMGGEGAGGFYATKRGAAKVLHDAAIVLAIIYVATALAYILV